MGGKYELLHNTFTKAFSVGERKDRGREKGCPTQVILWIPEADRVIFQTKDTMERRMICGY